MGTILILFKIMLVVYIYSVNAFLDCNLARFSTRSNVRQHTPIISRLNFSPADSNYEKERFVSRVCSSSSAREAIQLRDLKSRKWTRFIKGEEAENHPLNANSNEELERSDIEISQVAKRFIGFSLLSEILNGRLAMLGLSFGLLNEYITGKSLMEQIGFETDLPILSISFIISLITLINHTYRSKQQSLV